MGFHVLVRWHIYIESGPWIQLRLWSNLSTAKMCVVKLLLLRLVSHTHKPMKRQMNRDLHATSNYLGHFNTFRPETIWTPFADIFKRFFLNKNISISITVWPKFVAKCAINNKPALTRIMAWCRAIYRITWTLYTDAYIRHKTDNLVAKYDCAKRLVHISYVSWIIYIMAYHWIFVLV